MNRARNRFLGDLFEYQMFPATTLGGQLLPEFGRRVQENSQNYGANISSGGKVPLPGMPGGQ